MRLNNFYFRSITRSYYRNSVGVLLVYDITKRASFEHLVDWLDEASVHLDSTTAIFHLIGHKSDMESERSVTTREGRQFAEDHGLKFRETSALNGSNVEEAFHDIACDIYTALENGQFVIHDGWDGIKTGYGSSASASHHAAYGRQDSFTLEEQEPEQSKLCC